MRVSLSGAARTQVVAFSGAMAGTGTVTGNRFAIGYVDDTIWALGVEGVTPSA